MLKHLKKNRLFGWYKIIFSAVTYLYNCLKINKFTNVNKFISYQSKSLCLDIST